MKFDQVLEAIGGFGKYQKIQFFLAAIPAAVIALHQLASVFLAATPEYSCVRHETEDYLLASSVNLSAYGIEDERDNCLSYVLDNTTNSYKTEKCQNFIYSIEYFIKTIVTDWDLICDNKAKSTISTMVYMSGKLAGAFIFGLLSDILGRKKTFLLALLILGAAGIGAAFSPEYYTFIILRFIIAATATGTYMCLFVIGMELIGKSYRVLAGLGICYAFALGYVILAGIGYLSKNWVYTELSISAPVFLFLSYYWLMPESARWLISRNRIDEATQIVRRAAQVNGVKLPADMSLEQETTPKSSLRALCQAKTLLCRTLIIFLNWFAVSMGYYGLSLNSGSFGGSIYLNFMLSGAIEFVSYTACLSINKLGRKGPHIFGMLVAGLACFGTILVDQFMKGAPAAEVNTWLVTLNIIGKFGMTMGFAIIYIWSAEIYPTSLRTSLMGLSSMTGRVGQILAPLIAEIGKYVPAKYSITISGSIFGTLVIVSGLLTIALPETSGYDLPETVEEANVFPRKLSSETERDKHWSHTNQGFNPSTAETKFA